MSVIYLCQLLVHKKTVKDMDFLEMDVKPECTVDESVCLMHNVDVLDL